MVSTAHQVICLKMEEIPVYTDAIGAPVPQKNGCETKSLDPFYTSGIRGRLM